MTTPTETPTQYNPLSAGWDVFTAAQSMTRLAAQAFSGMASRPADDAQDPLNLNPALARLAGSALANPSHVLNAQAALVADMTLLWRRAAERALGMDVETVAEPAPGDRRFSHADWHEQPGYDLLKQGYLLGARAALDFIADAPGLDERTRAKLAFATAQVTDAASPTNFLATNPAALRRAVETRGRSVIDGMTKLLEDLSKSGGKLRPRMIDEGSFEVGKSLATTPGKVVYQNDLMQLIQYAPLTDKVHKRPLLVMPPWMNKYYIMDLRPEQLDDGVAGRSGAHGVHRLVGEPRRAPRRQGLRGLHARRAHRGARCHREGHRRAPGERRRLLSRRHPARRPPVRG